MVNLLMALKEAQPLPGENSARTFVNAVRQAVRAITNSLGTQDIAVDVLAATVLINGVSYQSYSHVFAWLCSHIFLNKLTCERVCL